MSIHNFDPFASQVLLKAKQDAKRYKENLKTVEVLQAMLNLEIINNEEFECLRESLSIGGDNFYSDDFREAVWEHYNQHLGN